MGSSLAGAPAQAGQVQLQCGPSCSHAAAVHRLYHRIFYWTHRLAQLAGDAALLAGRVPPQHVLPPEPRAEWSLLERVVDLRMLHMRRLHECRHIDCCMNRDVLATHQKQCALNASTSKVAAHRDFRVEEGLQRVVQPPEQLSQEQRLRALIQHCSDIRMPLGRASCGSAASLRPC